MDVKRCMRNTINSRILLSTELILKSINPLQPYYTCNVKSDTSRIDQLFSKFLPICVMLLGRMVRTLESLLKNNVKHHDEFLFKS